MEEWSNFTLQILLQIWGKNVRKKKTDVSSIKHRFQEKIPNYEE